MRFWVMGANEWRTATDWPLPETQWTKLYLSSWERLVPELPAAASTTETQLPDAFVQMPPTQTNTIQRLRYMTDPLPHDVLVAGPITLTLYASIDQDDTNWIVILKDIGPDVSVLSVREGEREVPKNLPSAKSRAAGSKPRTGRSTRCAQSRIGPGIHSRAMRKSQSRRVRSRNIRSR